VIKIFKPATILKKIFFIFFDGTIIVSLDTKIKCMKNIFFVGVLLLFGIYTVAQVDTAFYNKLKNDYERFFIEETKNFEKFKEDRDKEFLEFLKQDWENFKLFSEQKPITLPGPDKIPVYDKKNEKTPAKKLSQKKSNITEENEVYQISSNYVNIPVSETPASKKDYDDLTLNFYGSDFNLIFPKKFKEIEISYVNESNIANFWESILETDYYRVVGQMLDFKKYHSLNDWGYYKLVENCASRIYENTNSAKLLTWFLLSKSGYRVKVGYSGTNIYLLIPSINTIYGYSYFVLDNLKYYIFENGSGVKTIYTFRSNYPEANQIMNFNIYQTPVLGDLVVIKKLSFEYNGKTYNFDINYSKNLIDFYNDYPQGEIQIFFNAGISSYVKESLNKNIYPIIKDMGELEAANFLLAFVQLAFDYQTDQEQFGYEKFFFPEEIFHYKYCDCEDRAVFYSYLVRQFLNLPLVALNYPDHVATAVKFNELINGAYYLIDNSKYIVCDPTYINAPVGVCMPEYVKSEVNIIKLRSSESVNNITDDIWKNFVAKGFIKTNYSGDIVNPSKNLWFLTGLIEDEIVYNNNTIKPAENESMAFVAKSNDKAEILHIELIHGNGSLMPVGIAYSEGKIYLSGYFTHNIKVGDQTALNSGTKELFMICWDENFNLLWLRTSGLVHDIETSNMFFAANFDKKGNFLGYEKLSEQSSTGSENTVVDKGDKIVVYGKFDGSEVQLVNSSIYSSKNSYEFAMTWKNLTETYISQKYDIRVSGIIAFLAILQRGNISLESKEILASIIAMNQEFKNKYSETYDNLKQLKTIVSENGIIYVYANSQVRFGEIIFEDKAKFRINNIKAEIIDLMVINGIKCDLYGKFYEIESISINRKNGEIILNLNDNDKRKLNLNKNILK
jgi:hypothetical protein